MKKLNPISVSSASYHLVEIRAWLAEASNTRVAGQLSHWVPSAALFGSPVFTNAAMLAIIALDKASRPGLLAWLKANEKLLPVKFPNTKGRSIACDAPMTVYNGAGYWFQSNQ